MLVDPKNFKGPLRDGAIEPFWFLLLLSHCQVIPQRLGFRKLLLLPTLPKMALFGSKRLPKLRPAGGGGGNQLFLVATPHNSGWGLGKSQARKRTERNPTVAQVNGTPVHNSR